MIKNSLKGLCLKDTAVVLGQFCAEVLAYCLSTITIKRIWYHLTSNVFTPVANVYLKLPCMNLSWKLTWTSFCIMIFILWKVGFHFLWSLWSQNKVQLLTSVLAELLMISAIVWITRFPSFSSAIHNSSSCHTETGLTCACVNLSVFGDFFPSMFCVPDA